MKSNQPSICTYKITKTELSCNTTNYHDNKIQEAEGETVDGVACESTDGGRDDEEDKAEDGEEDEVEEDARGSLMISPEGAGNGNCIGIALTDS